MYSWIGICVYRFLFVPRKLLYLHILMPRLLELIFYLCLLQKTWSNIPRKISFLQPKLFSTRNTAVHTIWILLQHLMILLQNYYKLGGLKGEFTLLHHLFTVNIWKQWPQKEIVKGKSWIRRRGGAEGRRWLAVRWGWQRWYSRRLAQGRSLLFQ